MSSSSTSSALIVGAGSVGVMTALDLSRAGAAVTFLVRPHRQEQLSRPQILYSYDDQTLDTLSGYEVLTDPAALAGSSFDAVIVTLDSASLHAEAGQQLTQQLGRALKGTETAVVLASVGIELDSWFLEHSGLQAEQVAYGSTAALIHEVPAAAELPHHPGIEADLLAQADYAYRRFSPSVAFSVADSSPRLAETVKALFDAPGLPACDVVDASQLKVGPAAIAAILGWSLLGWPALADVEAANPTWVLGVRAMQEFQRLPVFGQAGQAAAEQTTPEGVLAQLQQAEQTSLPLDYAGFNAYHHGGKVNKQDVAVFRDAVSRADTETPALQELIDRLSAARS